MLKEKIAYRDDLPINVITASVREWPIHFHDDLEIVFVLEGGVALRNGYYTETMEQGDIFVINDREMHSLNGTGRDNRIMILQIDLEYFSKYYDNLTNCFFVTDNCGRSEKAVGVLRNLLIGIMTDVIRKGVGYKDRVIERAHNLIGCLMSDFNCFVLDEGKFKSKAGKKYDRIMAGRISRITDYMYENYDRKLTLNEISKQEHLSVYYLSHLIKEAAGLSFQDLLSYIRVEESERLLLGTKKRLSAISEEVGFSAIRYYNKHFKKWFGMTPGEYRERYSDKVYSHETGADYSMCTPDEIIDTVLLRTGDIEPHASEREYSNPVIVDIDVYDDLADVIKETPAMDEMLDRPANEIIAEPYRRLASMDENVIAHGENYVVTTRCEYPGSMDSLSILIYNFDENVSKELKNTKSQEELFHIAKQYDVESEFLIRCNGLVGDYNILRWKLDKNNIMERITRAIMLTDHMDPRQAILMKMATDPIVSGERIRCTDMLSVRGILKGVSAELILIDRKQ